MNLLCGNKKLRGYSKSLFFNATTYLTSTRCIGRGQRRNSINLAWRENDAHSSSTLNSNRIDNCGHSPLEEHDNSSISFLEDLNDKAIIKGNTFPTNYLPNNTLLCYNFCKTFDNKAR